MMHILFTLVLTVISGCSFAGSPASAPVEKPVSNPVKPAKVVKTVVVVPASSAPKDGILRNMIDRQNEEIRNGSWKSAPEKRKQ